MNKDAAIKLNERWICELQDAIDKKEEKMKVLERRIAAHKERIDSLTAEEVKGK